MTRLLLLLISEGAVTAAVHSATVRRWHGLTEVEVLTLGAGDLGVVLLHGAAWLAAWWLLLGTAHDLVVARAHRTRRRLAPRWVQRMVAQAIGTAMAVGAVAGPAAAAASPPSTPAALQVVLPPVPVLDLPPAASPAADASAPAVGPTGHATPDPGRPPEAGASPEEAPPPDAGDPSGPVAADQHVVAAGENLWTIARHLLVRVGLPHCDREVHAVWVELIRLNTAHLRSGDPDLIHPGEVLRLPAVPGEVGHGL